MSTKQTYPIYFLRHNILFFNYSFNAKKRKFKIRVNIFTQTPLLDHIFPFIKILKNLLNFILHFVFMMTSPCLLRRIFPIRRRVFLWMERVLEARKSGVAFHLFPWTKSRPQYPSEEPRIGTGRCPCRSLHRQTEAHGILGECRRGQTKND